MREVPPHLYLFTHPFLVITDNKAIESLFTKPGSKLTPRMERLLHRMSACEASVVHQPCEYNPADYLSRQPVGEASPEDFQVPEFSVNAIMAELFPAVSKPMSSRP